MIYACIDLYAFQNLLSRYDASWPQPASTCSGLPCGPSPIGRPHAGPCAMRHPAMQYGRPVGYARWCRLGPDFRRLPQRLWGWRQWRLTWRCSAVGCSTPKRLLPPLPQLPAPASQANRPAALAHDCAACCLRLRAKAPDCFQENSDPDGLAQPFGSETYWNHLGPLGWHFWRPLEHKRFGHGLMVPLSIRQVIQLELPLLYQYYFYMNTTTTTPPNPQGETRGGLSHPLFACGWWFPTSHAPCGRECSPNHASHLLALRVAGDYSPALPSPCLLARVRGVFPAMPHVARAYSPATRSVLVRQPPASTATATQAALDLHRRRRHRWHHGLWRWTMVPCPRTTIAVTWMIAVLCGCYMVATVAHWKIMIMLWMPLLGLSKWGVALLRRSWFFISFLFCYNCSDWVLAQP